MMDNNRVLTSLSMLLSPQDNDFCLLKPGDPAFVSLSGETICYEGEALYPFFVNEGAYYEQNTAFKLAQRETLLLPAVSVKKPQ